MILFNITYEVSNGMTFICDVVGKDEQDVILSITSQVGTIKVISLFRKSSVHRVTDNIRKMLVDQLMKDTPKKGVGRPRKI